MFDANSEYSSQIINLWWVLLGFSLLIFTLVISFLLLSLIKRKPNLSDRIFNRYLAGIIGVTFILLISLLVFSYRTQVPSIDKGRDSLTIEITGYRWWWKVKYYSKENNFLFETANEIYLPVNQPVRLRLLSADVIHSLWIPQLVGKMDMIPGHTNYLWIHPNKTGEFRGQCAEYCGVQHAKMAIYTYVVSNQEFTHWMERQKKPASENNDPVIALGKKVYQKSGCMSCHSIRDEFWIQDPIGPDLTHLASRKRLIAGSVPNNLGNLTGWIADPQHLKSGSFMPAIPLESNEFNALIKYLRSLK